MISPRSAPSPTSTAPASAPAASPPQPSAHERLYRSLRGRIMLGELPPGKALTLRGIAAEARVSMTPRARRCGGWWPKGR